ncbi:TIGR03621 family F420-dependent LLM class oxidoreductase [Nonomuraea sp. MG754425]|uniref:TIGR03621 family F420-dependent LLM class oxidoreductase n=1 Tax=Nonomuraea sp. MG754425 TaxID=2570319 RepID=UPI001F02BCC3|nr:TIGR03621 family F420-dependent LLM class oxidoreductase [Nonomuraea sp. MG754425]MCF6473187.1 TIGR03621 family F420-dependent LLM class oxidoreductase [Nonomuraea sp. MG754425]
MTGRAFRFGVALRAAADRREWMEKCRKAEDVGFDTISVIDHLGNLAPFPAMVLAAEATERARIGTYVLNATLYAPALLVRDIATTDLLIDGRLELGLAAGRPSASREKLQALGMPYPTPAERATLLENVVSDLNRLFTDPAVNPAPSRRRPPLLLAGRAGRVLRLAAAHADIVAFNGGADGPNDRVGLPVFAGVEAIAERVELVKSLLGDRITEVEFNHEAPAVIVTAARRAALERLQHLAPSLSIAERGEVPGFLVGTSEQIVDKLIENRERFGFTYITVLEGGLDAMEPVIELLRQS